MLVLTRKSNQSIMIGDDIEVSVLSIMGEKVRIGIQAPRDVPVFRREVYLEIQQERRGARRGRGAPRPHRGRDGAPQARRAVGTARPRGVARAGGHAHGNPAPGRRSLSP
jgi:carbon storage regulator